METKSAKLVAKTISVNGSGNVGFGGIRTYYYLTFEFENRTRLYFEVKDEVYVLLAEGDEGILTYERKKTWEGEKLEFGSFDRAL